jgi:hypothetical protein
VRGTTGPNSSVPMVVDPLGGRVEWVTTCAGSMGPVLATCPIYPLKSADKGKLSSQHTCPLPKSAGYLSSWQLTGPGDRVCVNLSPKKEQALCAIVDWYDNRYEYTLTRRKYPT